MDTIWLWLPFTEIGQGYMENVPPILHNLTESYSNATQSRSFHGDLLGMRVSGYETGISIKGSLCKSYLGNNLEGIGRQDTQRAIEQIEDCLMLKIQNATVRRLDFGKNIITQKSVKEYFPLFGYSNKLQRLEQPNTIYYQNGLKCLAFYDKKEEAKKSKQKIPDIWEGMNVMRYEIRYTSRLPKQFNTDKVQAKHLYQESFYIELINKWAKSYFNIEKKPIFTLNKDEVKKTTDIDKLLISYAINEIGIDNLMNFIDQIKAAKQFKHDAEYSRAKKRIKEHYRPNGVYLIQNDLITELDSKIKRAKVFYR